MSRNKPRVRFHPDTGDVTCLSATEIKAILRAADELIAQGGRSLLEKILIGFSTCLCQIKNFLYF